MDASWCPDARCARPIAPRSGRRLILLSNGEATDGSVVGFVITQRALVAVVDDSESVRESLPDLLEQVGFAVQAFESAEAFLESGVGAAAGCLVLDVGLPGISGPELQQLLKRRGQAIPIVFITAQGDKSLQPRLLAAGAVACLFKPFSDDALLEAVGVAIQTRKT